ncbi:hypothetical protein [Bacillus thuringiensis]|uniref:hypothetical protein n=1 Tax=Bacillus thuringiensis TaxID=1428 RepID=UPI003459ED15
MFYKTLTIKEYDLLQAKFSLYIDNEKKELHLLDLNENGTKSVTNAVSDDFIYQLQSELVDNQHIEVFNNFKIFTYAPLDGTVSNYEPQEDSFTYVTKVGTSDLMFLPFALEFTSLYNKFQGGKLCPRCESRYMDVREARNALSRRGDYYVCSPCGTAEAMEDMQ